jgi:hypothetical protein
MDDDMISDISRPSKLEGGEEDNVRSNLRYSRSIQDE